MYKHKWERDEQSQTRENCFEVRAPLLYVPAFNTMKDFHENRSRKITQCRNTYNEFTLELLDPQVPNLFLQEQHTQAHKLAEVATLHRAPTKTRNKTNLQVRIIKYKNEYLVISTLWSPKGDE